MLECVRIGDDPFPAPGGIKVYLTGQAVEHPDGTRLQRALGLLPTLKFRPTISGIADGVDQVLDRAIKYLKEL